MAKKKNIDEFWSWFAQHSAQLVVLLEADKGYEIANEVDPRIRQLCAEIGWEIGPVDESSNFLAFTLKGNIENYDAIKAIVDAAPPLDRWQLFIGRPKRDLANSINFRNPRGKEISVDLRDWRYVLTAFDGNTFFDVTVATDRLPRMDKAGKERVLETVLNMSIGEFNALKYVDGVTFISKPDSKWEEVATPMQYLSSHLESLLNPR